ncbi:hypothetical protein C3K47_04950 [Solitalea longa]|uniref:Uncharacterized protein n=1 Tax=Solitalea longa TaxID=2079460 RepID=A0A2S5A5K7_9SPHI|nr:hypothetical protein [Solitalea longa]POY37880.1 hypothetical protein C3K47_04950 [Solitalea longa]
MKLKSLFILLISGVLLATASGCSKDDDNDNPQPQQPDGNSNGLAFLKVGNEWIYDYTAVDATGIVKYKILSKENNGYFKVNWFMGGDFEVFWHEADGAFSFMSEGQGGLNLILYKKDCKVGDSWTIKAVDDNQTEVTATNKVTSVGESVTTTAGTFNNCVKVHYTTSEDTKLHMNFYVHPQFGIVKMDGVGIMEIDHIPTYFPFQYVLKSKNF